MQKIVYSIIEALFSILIEVHKFLVVWNFTHRSTEVQFTSTLYSLMLIINKVNLPLAYIEEVTKVKLLY